MYSNRAIVEGGGLISYGPLIYFQAFMGSVALPAAGYDYNSVWTPCMGIWMSRSFSKHGASFLLRFFVRSESRFLRSLIAATNASAYFLLFDCAAGFLPRRRAQELSTTTKGLALTVPSTAAPSNAGLVSKMTIRGEPRVRARTYRATTLYSVGQGPEP